MNISEGPDLSASSFPIPAVLVDTHTGITCTLSHRCDAHLLREVVVLEFHSLSLHKGDVSLGYPTDDNCLLSGVQTQHLCIYDPQHPQHRGRFVEGADMSTSSWERKIVNKQNKNTDYFLIY